MYSPVRIKGSVADKFNRAQMAIRTCLQICTFYMGDWSYMYVFLVKLGPKMAIDVWNIQSTIFKEHININVTEGP